MINKKKIERLIYELLEAIGENPLREGLKETPHRVAKMYKEIFAGMEENPKEHVKMFNESGQGNELILVKDIPFYSMCEHHLLPFFGTIHIAYIPSRGRIIGLSKIVRIVNCYTKQLQIQERMTREIADFIFSDLETSGAAVFVEAEHLCMTMRGVKSPGAKTKTYSLKGLLSSDQKKKEELYSLL